MPKAAGSLSSAISDKSLGGKAKVKVAGMLLHALAWMAASTHTLTHPACLHPHPHPHIRAPRLAPGVPTRWRCVSPPGADVAAISRGKIYI